MESAPIKSRCAWCGEDPLYVRYHDEEWGVPVFEDRKLFEFLILEGAQAGLSWLTVLRKRENYRQAFDGFDPEKIACYDNRKIESLLKNSGLIRNRLKIESTIRNAKAFLKVKDEFGSFSAYQWQFVNGQPIKSKLKSLKELPAKTPQSDVFSRELKKRGFNFVGSTIIYAHMQATGMVNDHLVSCFRH
jgi:DNA-3-methyladenine glycosylase I